MFDSSGNEIYLTQTFPRTFETSRVFKRKETKLETQNLTQTFPRTFETGRVLNVKKQNLEV